jgi:hypothetical protein
MLVDLSTSADTTITIRFSYTDFSTGGTATAAPTSANSWAHTSDGTTGVAITWNDGTATGHKLHRVTDADGNFWFLTSKNTSGLFHTLIGVQTLSETRTGETKPTFSFFQYQNGARGCGSVNPNPLGTVPTGYFEDCADRSSGTGAIVVGGRTYDNSAFSVCCAVIPGISQHAGQGLSTPAETTASRIWRAQSNGADSKYDFFPLWIYSATNNLSGVRGRVPDASIVCSGPTVGAGAPSAAAQERIVVGNLVLPFDNVAPSL